VKLEPGSVVLTPDETAELRGLVDRWNRARARLTDESLWDTAVDLAQTVDSLLTQASDDERKPVVR
jgi:type IV pilus biogenesis protein CpaD/CtpE